jgi:transcriptional regulator with XRE-family HTH domain
MDVGEWLGLDEADMKGIGFRVTLVKAIRRSREGSNVSQATLTERIGTSQPNIAKIEAGGTGVSLDLLMRVFLATGESLAELAGVVGTGQGPRQ